MMQFTSTSAKSSIHFNCDINQSISSELIQREKKWHNNVNNGMAVKNFLACIKIWGENIHGTLSNLKFPGKWFFKIVFFFLNLPNEFFSQGLKIKGKKRYTFKRVRISFTYVCILLDDAESHISVGSRIFKRLARRMGHSRVTMLLTSTIWRLCLYCI